MSNYILNVLFDPSDLQELRIVGEKVTLIKSTSSGSNLAWVVFDPFEQNEIDWTEGYYVYASKSEIQSGALIKKVSFKQANSGESYAFRNSIFETGLPGDTGINSYKVYNLNAPPERLIFGLAQDVKVNGKKYDVNPINADPVLYSHSDVITPIERVSIFMERKIYSSMVLSDIKGTSLEVDLTGAPEATVKYNLLKGGFDLV
ncbi:MAG: hypothetical protein ABSC17_02885 [Thermacetogeniaceae bacterium]